MNTVMSETQIFEAQGRTKCTSVAMAEHLVTAQKQDAHTRLELAKAVREIKNPYEPCTKSHAGFHQAISAVLKLIEEKG